jgi:hypothetical protein
MRARPSPAISILPPTRHLLFIGAVNPAQRRCDFITEPGTLYFESAGNAACPGVMEPREDNVDSPAERSDPGGFKACLCGR